MASNKMTTNAWSGPLAAAVGALYKDYMTRPTAADALKAQLMQEQLATAPMEREKLQLGNQSAQRLYDMGGWDGAPAIVQEKLFGDSLSAQDRGRYEDIYVTKPSWQDFGDQKVLMGVNGPINARTVGAPPRTEVNNETLQARRVNAIPSQEVFPRTLGQQPAQPQQGSGLFPSNLTQGRGVGAQDIDTSNIQPVSMETMNEPVARGQTPIPLLLPTQGDSVGIPLSISSDDPSLYGGAQQPAQTGGSLVGAVQQLPMGGDDKRKLDEGRRKVTELTNQMLEAYNKLEANKGAISGNNTDFTNIGNSIAASDFGQIFGRALNTPAQQARTDIENMKSTQLLNLKPAAEIAAQQMNTKEELNQLMNMLGSPGQDVDVARAALQRIENQYGMGAANYANPDVMSKLVADTQSALQQTQRIKNQNTKDDVITIQSDEDYDLVSRGSLYKGPDGEIRRKQ